MLHAECHSKKVYSLAAKISYFDAELIIHKKLLMLPVEYSIISIKK